MKKIVGNLLVVVFVAVRNIVAGVITHKSALWVVRMAQNLVSVQLGRMDIAEVNHVQFINYVEIVLLIHIVAGVGQIRTVVVSLVVLMAPKQMFVRLGTGYTPRCIRIRRFTRLKRALQTTAPTCWICATDARTARCWTMLLPSPPHRLHRLWSLTP